MPPGGPTQRRRPFLLAALLAAAALGSTPLLFARWPAGPRHEPPAFVATSGPSPAERLHRFVVGSHSTYPLLLMIGYNCYGNVLLRKACGGRPYPTWLFGYLLGFLCYTYPSAMVSDLLFGHAAPRCMGNDNILMIYSFWFVLIQSSDRVYDFLVRPRIFALLTMWWLADATRASLCYLERAVAHEAVFAKGIFHSAAWVSAGPFLRALEARARGAEPVPMEQVLPNSINALKYPLLSMFATMVVWLVYLGYFTDCGIFEGGVTMVECGELHDDVYAAFFYAAVSLQVVRTAAAFRRLGQCKGNALPAACSRERARRAVRGGGAELPPQNSRGAS